MTEPTPAPGARQDGPHPASGEPSAAVFTPAGRLGFRFAFVYFLLYGPERALPWLPGTRGLLALYQALWRTVVPWVGRHLLRHLLGGREISVAPTGSGDRTFDYVQVLSMLVLAALAALVWTAVDRRGRRGRPDGGRDRRLWEALRIGVRYTLGLTLLAYGMSNLFKVQFPFPTAARLEERIGDSSPLAFFQVFMGYSAPYCAAIGASQALAGLLLFFRRTVTLGALASLVVLANEVALAFCYDVPAKLLTTHLLLLALFLLAPDLRRLLDGIVLDRPTRPALSDLAPPFPHRFRAGRLAVKALVVGYALFAMTRHSLDLRQELARRPPLENPSRYLLVTRGVHVINDDPLNQ